MKDKIIKQIEYLEELYDEYLRRTEDVYYQGTYAILEQRLHDLRIEINTYKKVIDMIGDEENA